MSVKQSPLTVITCDFVEPNLDWEVGRYADAGVIYRYYQLRQAAPKELLENIADADVLVVDQAKITDEVMRGLHRCKLIVRHGEGYDNLNLEAATQAGIVCVNQPGYFSQNVAEQTFAMALSLALRVPVQQEIAAAPAADSGWLYHKAMPYSSLGALSVGIIGYGKIGRKTAELFKPVAARVRVYAPRADTGGLSMALDNLLSQSDIICLHVPATSETVGMFDRKTLAKMKKGAIFINTARGAIVDTDALVQALESGQLAGAALDCTQPEPLPKDHPLHSMSNVIITPHMSWYSENALWSIRRAIMDDVLGVLRNRIPQTVVNPEVFKNPDCRLGFP